MSVQEFRTAVEGQLFILNNASTDIQVISAIKALINIRKCIGGYNSDRYATLCETIDDTVRQFTVGVFDPKPCYAIEQAKSIDDKIDDMVDSMCGDSTVAKLTGVVLTLFYSYAYYVWFNSY